MSVAAVSFAFFHKKRVMAAVDDLHAKEIEAKRKATYVFCLYFCTP